MVFADIIKVFGAFFRHTASCVFTVSSVRCHGCFVLTSQPAVSKAGI